MDSGGTIGTSARSVRTSTGISSATGRGRPPVIAAKASATAAGISGTLVTRRQ